MKQLRSIFVAVFLCLFCSTSLSANWIEERVKYRAGDDLFEGVLVYNASIDRAAPAVLMVPNWMGVTDAAIDKAKALAGDTYVFFVADMYGVSIRPKNSSEAGQAAGFVRADRALMRARAQAALDTFLALEDAPIDPLKTAAIGFCFGGGTVLELGRAGADLDAIVSFHGDLMSPTLDADAGNNQAGILVLHGADDPFVPQEHVQTFVAAMQSTSADWQLIQYSGTVHSFTDPSAAMQGKAEYHPRSAQRAFAAMQQLFEEVLGPR